MALTLGDNFSYQGAKPLDARLKYDTLAAMKAVADSTMYEGCICYCVATDKTYQWKSANTVDADTGKWRELETGGVDTAKVYLTDDTLESTLADNDKFPFYDTSASEKRNITFQNFKSYIPMPVMGTFSKGDLYSTTEKVVGCWRDGRPIYQKTISIGGLKTHNTAHGISNLKEVVDTECACVSSSPSSVAHVTFSGSWALFQNVSVTIAISPTNIEMGSKNPSGSEYDVSSTYSNCYVTVRYTKTTDAANSFNYASENDYSTTEHIIGTWVDGSTLYQRTFTGTANYGTSTSISFAYAHKIKKMNGLFTDYSTYSVNIPIYTGSDNWTNMYTYNGAIVIDNHMNSHVNAPYIIIVQYTK